ncbi:MAG: hypothetical protein QME58_07135 [Bacteroidota bacterium]|nr:hypothetical protein [Bacteroidota bacterium]
MSLKIKETQVLYDAKGKKTHVLLSYKKYQEFIEMFEDMEDLALMKEVEKEKSIPWEVVKKNLDKKKK